MLKRHEVFLILSSVKQQVFASVGFVFYSFLNTKQTSPFFNQSTKEIEPVNGFKMSVFPLLKLKNTLLKRTSTNKNK
mgnify:CR=1 FL=1